MSIHNLEQVFLTATSGMSSETIRMNTIASNLANANTVGSTEAGTYHAKTPIFSEVTHDLPGLNKADQPIGGVNVTDIKTTDKPLSKHYEPDHPLAGPDGYIYMTDVNPIREITNMIAASKEYQADVEVMNSTKNLITQTISVLNTK